MLMKHEPNGIAEVSEVLPHNPFYWFIFFDILLVQLLIFEKPSLMLILMVTIQHLKPAHTFNYNVVTKKHVQ